MKLSLSIFLIAFLKSTWAQETAFIDDGIACTHPTGCQNNTIGDYLNISGVSCTGEMACSDNTLSDFTARTSCTGPKSADKPYGTCSMNGVASDRGSISAQGTNICSGASSCSNNSADTFIVGGGSDYEYANLCSGKHSCSDNELGLITMGANGNTCTGDDSCTYLQKSGELVEIQDFSVDTNCCTGARSCRHGVGQAIILPDSCTGDDSCQNWRVGSDIGALFSAGNASCTGVNSCQNLQITGTPTFEYIAVLEGACTGANSCQNLTSEGVEMTIETGACTEDNSCQNCNGRSWFQAGVQSCSEPEGMTSGAMDIGNVGAQMMSLGAVIGAFLLI